MSDTLLSVTVEAVARRIGAQLPAAYGTDPQELLVAGDIDAHVMPEDAIVVRWALGTDDGYLVLGLTNDAAEMLAAGPPETTVLEALSACVEAAAIDLAAIFDGIPPMLGQGEEIDPAAALADGPGDPVSVALDDGGVHRATVGLRLVVSDTLMAPPPVDEPAAGADPAEGQRLEAEQGAAAGAGVPLEGQGAVVGADGVPLTAEQAAAGGVPSAAGSGAGQPGIVGGGPSPQRRAAQRGPVDAPVGEATPAEFSGFDQLSALPGQPQSMSLLGDVELGVTAELGRTELTVRDVLGLTPGSIIELDRAAGSPVDVVVNGTLIARGEVVVIDEEFGIRITEILGMVDQANPFPLAQ